MLYAKQPAPQLGIWPAIVGAALQLFSASQKTDGGALPLIQQIEAQEAAETRRTWLMIGGGVAVLAVGGVLFYVLRRKKKR